MCLLCGLIAFPAIGCISPGGVNIIIISVQTHQIPRVLAAIRCAGDDWRLSIPKLSQKILCRTGITLTHGRTI